MNIFKKISDAATGGLGETIFKFAKTYFPPSMSDEQKDHARLSFMQLEETMAARVDAAINEAQRLHTEQISALEGTAKDLLMMPVVGRLMIFLRGCQRPMWGFFTMYLDYSWLTKPSTAFTEQQQTAFIVINLLVLGFLFGERAIKNAMPLITRMLKAKAGA